MRIARVFPSRTKATPVDDLAFYDEPGLFPVEVDEVHVSVTFMWDMDRAESLARDWERIAPVKIGGPATGMRGEDFVSGMYLKPGYVITSRGCPNRCWFCSVPKREGNQVRELPIVDGWNVLDDNLLACSDTHVKTVFDMLRRQRRRPEFTGGFEAARLQEWHVHELATLHPESMFFAYDTPDDYEPLVRAGKLLEEAGFRHGSHRTRCYVLIGYPNDTFERAEKRLLQAIEAGFFPMAMLWRDEKNMTTRDWRTFQREWVRPRILGEKIGLIFTGRLGKV